MTAGIWREYRKVRRGSGIGFDEQLGCCVDKGGSEITSRQARSSKAGQGINIDSLVWHTGPTLSYAGTPIDRWDLWRPARSSI